MLYLCNDLKLVIYDTETEPSLTTESDCSQVQIRVI